MILVDTSVLIPYIAHGRGRFADAFDAELKINDAVAITPVIFQEVLQGASSELHWKRLRTKLLAFHLLEPAAGLSSVEGAARIYAECRWVGITIRNPSDCLIARIAMENDVPILHNDRDFVHMQKVVPALRLL
jgi:predicted nucleic acid-binding protein